MSEEVLSILRQAPGYVSGAAICKTLGVSRTAVWKAIEKLRQAGYEIESAPNRGYRLVQATRALCRQEILTHLKDCPWKDTVLVLEQVDSTNNRAKELAAQGAPAGTVVIADSQTGGRGRLGRSFASPPGMGVYLSAILRPACPAQELMHLTCAVAVAMCNAVEEAAGFRPGIKWTNDLVYQRRKLTGILTELALEAEISQVQYAVVGVGINCCQKPTDFPPEIREKAGSLAMMTPNPIDRNRLAAAMIQALVRMDATLLTDKTQIMAQYRADCITLGQEVCLVRADTIRHGKALDVGPDGDLVVEFAPGQVESVASGEVSVRGLYDYL